MKRNGALVNYLFTYSSVTHDHEYCNDAIVSKAFELLEDMLDRGVTCKAERCNTLIAGLCRQRKVLKLQMKEGSIESELTTLFFMVTALLVPTRTHIRLTETNSID